jgi:hypothetical protein
VVRQDDILCVTDVADLLCVDSKVATRLMREMGDVVVEVYRANSITPTLTIGSLVRWISDPMNWYCVDVERIVDDRLKTAVSKAKRHWSDDWVGTGYGASYLHVSVSWLNEQIRLGNVKGRKYGHNWKLLMSEIDRVKGDMDSGQYWTNAVKRKDV